MCPIHRWTYDLKGELLGAPHFADKPCLNLGRTPLQNWNGLLFDGPRDVARDLAALGVRDFDFSGYVLDRVELHECNYNWKTFIEVYLEDYHVGPFHPGLGQFVTCDDLTWEFGDWASVQTVGINNGLAKPGSRTYERWHKAVLDFYRGEIPPHGAIWLTYYPNIMVEWYPHVLVVSTLIPEAVDRTLNVVEFYYPEEIALFEREFVEAEQAAYMETAKEDDEIAERMDAGRRALCAGRAQRGRPVPVADGRRHAALPRVLPAARWKRTSRTCDARPARARGPRRRRLPMQSLWMVAAGLSFALMGVCVKFGAAQFSAAELVFYRALVQTAGAFALLTHQGLSVRTARFGMHVHRGVAGFVSLFTFFYALTSLPVATAMTLNYTSPVFLTLLLAVVRARTAGRAPRRHRADRVRRLRAAAAADDRRQPVLARGRRPGVGRDLVGRVLERARTGPRAGARGARRLLLRRLRAARVARVDGAADLASGDARQRRAAGRASACSAAWASSR